MIYNDNYFFYYLRFIDKCNHRTIIEWVRAVADVDAFDAFGDFSDHREELMRQVLRHGGEVASDLDTQVGDFGEWVLPLVGDQAYFDHV